MAEPTAKGLKAGEAYLRAIANDPASKAALMRVRAHLLVVATVMNSPEFRAALEAQRQVSQEWADALRESVRRTCDELEAQHFPRPETLEDWQVLGRIVEIPEEYLQTGGWTAREIYERAMAWAQRVKIKVKLATEARAELDGPKTAAPASTPAEETRPKRSSERGEARAKLIAALTNHHQYANGGCLNLEPIGNNELARLAKVGKGRASDFFDKEFHGHIEYRALCTEAPLLVAALKALNGEFRPRDFYDARRPEEIEREDD